MITFAAETIITLPW